MFSGERNFFVAYGRAAGCPEELVRELGETYEIMNTNIKRWSVGSPIQAPLDSLLDLIREHRIQADDVEKLVVRVAHSGANTTDNREMPDICMQHLCAVMLLDGTVTLQVGARREAHARSRRCSSCAAASSSYGDDALTQAMPRREGIVEITLKDGRELAHHTGAVRGTPENPMTRAEVDAKGYDLMAPVLGSARSQSCARRCGVWKDRRARHCCCAR